MTKSRNGTYVLAVLVGLQVCSMPDPVHSGRMLNFATHALLGYIGFAVVLLWFAARHARPLSFRPRFWTSANVATVLLLATSTWVAWRTRYCQFEISAAAALLLGALVRLHRRNAGNSGRVQTPRPPACASQAMPNFGP